MDSIPNFLTFRRTLPKTKQEIFTFMEDTTTWLFVWGFDPEVEEPEIFDLLYNYGGTSLESVSIYRDERQNSWTSKRCLETHNMVFFFF